MARAGALTEDINQFKDGRDGDESDQEQTLSELQCVQRETGFEL